MKNTEMAVYFCEKVYDALTNTLFHFSHKCAIINATKQRTYARRKELYGKEKTQR